jgi:hypothetical protein
MNLDASVVRTEAMPAANRGASNSQLETFLSEWEAELTRRLGELPENDAFLRGILRDLAAASGMRKIARTDEDYRAAQELHDSAIERLGAYPEVAPVSSIRVSSLPWTASPVASE